MNPIELSTKIAGQAEGKSDRFLLICIIVLAFIFLVGMVLRMERYIREQMKEAREQTKQLVEVVTDNNAILDRTERSIRQNSHELKKFRERGEPHHE